LTKNAALVIFDRLPSVFFILSGDLTMKDEKLLQRIVLNPKVMAGKPVIKGTRLTVDFILNLFAHGAKEDEILDEYKDLTQEDIQACFLFATKSLESTEFMPLMEEKA
jgi:uncharacterized protein (DUF433 family)